MAHFKVVRVSESSWGNLETAPIQFRLAPAGVEAVRLTDGNRFVINTSYKPAAIRVVRGMRDRIAGRALSGSVEMNGYEVLWLE